MKFKDYYHALGVERTATAEQIKHAYRKLARKYHPDISKDPLGKEKFQEIGEAYAALKDPEKRQAYDDLGKQPVGEKFTPPPDWRQNFQAGDTNFDDVDLADLFAAFGSGQQRSARQENRPLRGQDFEVAASISLEQIFRGDAIEIRAELPEYDNNALPHRVAHTFLVNIPKGAADNQRLRLTGKGGHGLHGGHAGDLYVALALMPHDYYRVSGRDLYVDLPLAPWEAVLGAAIQIPTLAGTVELTIKPGTISGQKLRLAKRGLPSADGNFGALIAIIKIEVPKTVDAAERALYEQLAEAATFNPRNHVAPGVNQ
jgi:curved DNA-binding protein